MQFKRDNNDNPSGLQWLVSCDMGGEYQFTLGEFLTMLKLTFDKGTIQIQEIRSQIAPGMSALRPSEQ